MIQPVYQNQLSMVNPISYLRNWLFPKSTFLQVIHIQPNMRVLDFGCGRGLYALAAAEKVGPAGKVYALDKNPAILDYVKKEACQCGFNNVETIRSDFSINLPNASLDIVFLFDIFYLLDRPEKYLAEIQKVLKPAGQLCVKDSHLKPGDLVMRIVLSGYFTFNKQGDWMLLFRNILSNVNPRPLDTGVITNSMK
jgi:ubiquinone/menaquinone biosynthesis C-methylase UbiE